MSSLSTEMAQSEATDGGKGLPRSERAEGEGSLPKRCHRQGLRGPQFLMVNGSRGYSVARVGSARLI